MIQKMFLLALLLVSFGCTDDMLAPLEIEEMEQTAQVVVTACGTGQIALAPTPEQVADFEAAALASVMFADESSGFESPFVRDMYHPDIDAWSILGGFVSFLEICNQSHPAIFTYDLDPDSLKINHRIRLLKRDGTCEEFFLDGEGKSVYIGLEGESFVQVPLSGLPAEATDTITSLRGFQVDWEEGYNNVEWFALLEAAGQTDRCFWPDIDEGTAYYLFDDVARRFQVIGNGLDFIGRFTHNPFDQDENFIIHSPDDDATLINNVQLVDIHDHPLYEEGIQKIQLDDGLFYYPAMDVNVTSIQSLPELDASSFNDCP